MIVLTEIQANKIKGNYGSYSRLEPVKIPFTDYYMVSESVLSDAEFESIWHDLIVLPQADVKIEYNEDGEPISTELKWVWLHNYAIRIVVPKWLIIQMRQILIFKSYFEVMGLPIEILPDEIHLYCNEILENDIETVENLKPYGVKVETRITETTGILQ
jgi:hypothetical protein